jgi:hypothetical protein
MTSPQPIDTAEHPSLPTTTEPIISEVQNVFEIQLDFLQETLRDKGLRLDVPDLIKIATELTNTTIVARAISTIGVTQRTGENA